MPLSGLEIVGIAVTCLGSVGSAIGVVFKYGVRLALVEKTANEANTDSKQNGKDIASTTSRVNTMEVTLQEIQRSLSKLDNLPTIMSNLSYVSQQLEQMVPRREHEARWAGFDSKIDGLKDQIAEVREQLDK